MKALLEHLYSMKINEQTRKLDAGCSKHCFEVADRADVVWRDFRRVLFKVKKKEVGSMFNLEIFRSKDSLLLLEKEKPEIVRRVAI